LKPASLLQSARYYDTNNSFFPGGGGLYSTLDDYAIFCQMLLNRGNHNGVDIVQPETIEQVFSNQLATISNQRQFKFGLGFEIFPEGDYGWGEQSERGFGLTQYKSSRSFS
jgi:CubicO group peptidase (beta-lactamase class C family)